ncbi:energy-coupling factor ABC transporter ATP-binding protein, partial [Enterococcus faecalis]
ITHDLSEALESDHVVIMNKGKVYKEGKPNFIFLNTQYLVEIGLDLPFAMKMNQKLGFKDEFTTYEGLVDKL